LEALYKFLRSVKLAVVLILVIAALSILATLIPQRQEAAFYFHTYSQTLARVVLALGFDNFFRSVVFLAPVALFFVNLSVCMVDRMLVRSRRRARRRHGPDLIHLGLLVLIVGALFSVFARREAMVYLAEGEQILLPDDYSLRVLDFAFERYPDGRPKDWISTVAVTRRGEEVIPSYAIEVNKPLKINRVKVYQTSYADEARAELTGPDGKRYTIRSGEGFEWQGNLLLFQAVEQPASEDAGRAIFEEWKGHERVDVLRLARGETVGQYRVEDMSTRLVTGLKAVRDPGYLPVVLALILVAAGLSLTLLQKGRDMEREEQE
jgi:cytochrome c biogenesis protein ResB